MKLLTKILISLFATTSNAWAWGDTGHRIICEMTLRLVAPATRAEIDRLMKEDVDFQSFADACIWADRPRKRAAEHFVNLPRDAAGLGAENCIEAPECVVSAINRDLAVLSSGDGDSRRKLEALKFLGHWVGDVHQPLHVSFVDDRGGNSIKVRGECTGNLHAAWDACLVQKAVGENVEVAVTTLMQTITPEGSARWHQTGIKDWANESLAITLSPETRYCVREGKSCNPSGELVLIDAAYLDANIPKVREQLQKAAVRLAGLLNQAFATKP